MKADREASIRALLPMVRRMARRMHGTIGGSEFDDLFGDGCVGLIRAIDAYDPSRGTSLISYARPVIVGTMLNGIRRRDPVSERVRRTIRLAEDLRFRLAGERGQIPSRNEMEQCVPGLREATLKAHRHTPISLDMTQPGEEVTIPDWSLNPAQIAARRDREHRVRAAIGALPERQRKVVALHYFAEVSFHTMSRRMNVTPQRVSQLHRVALAKLRRMIGTPPT